MDKKRLTTVKTRIKQITSGQFIKQEGMNPSYVLSPIGQRLARVRVLATVVDKFASDTGKFAALSLDDGTDTIRAKVFNALSMIEGTNVGDIVDVIGRIKEYNGEIYIAPEIITKSDANFEMLRELEIRNEDKRIKKIRETVMQYKAQTTDMSELTLLMKERFGVDAEVVESVLQTQNVVVGEDKIDAKAMVLGLVEKLDTGPGCDYAELLEASKLSEEVMDSVINDLLSEGSCFEPRPGKIKKL